MTTYEQFITAGRASTSTVHRDSRQTGLLLLPSWLGADRPHEGASTTTGPLVPSQDSAAIEGVLGIKVDLAIAFSLNPFKNEVDIFHGVLEEEAWVSVSI